MKEKNQRWHQEIERYTMFLDWKNQYCEILLKIIYRFNAILIKLARAFFTWLEKITICMEIQKTLGSQSNLFFLILFLNFTILIGSAIYRNESATGGIRLPDFRLYCKASVINTVWYGHKNRNIGQWIESPEINPWNYGQKYTLEKREPLQKVALGKPDNYM